MDLHKIGIKFFAANPNVVEMRTFIPVFHRWIQEQCIPGHLLLDVHDYSHVPEGPGILLVAQEGNFCMDEANGRVGLLYHRKLPIAGAPEARMNVVLKTALTACQLLERDPALKGLTFRVDDTAIFANDRMQVPNTAAATDQFKELSLASVRPLFGQATVDAVAATGDARDRVTLTLKGPATARVSDLVSKLS